MNAHRHALACFWALEEGEKEPPRRSGAKSVMGAGYVSRAGSHRRLACYWPRPEALPLLCPRMVGQL